MSKGSLHLPTLLFQVACWLWWSVSEMISWQLYLWHEPRLRSCTSRISYSYGMYSYMSWRADMQMAYTIYASHRSHMLQPGSPISRGVSASSRVGLCRRTCTHTSPWRCLMDHHGPPGSLGSSYVSYVMFSESSHVGLSPARCAECSPSLLAITIWARKVPERRTRELFKCTLYMSKLCPE